MIYFSNDLYCLANGLSQALFENASKGPLHNSGRMSPFDQKIVIVPSDRYKRMLQEFFATHSRFSVAMGLKIQTLPEYLLAQRQGARIPSFCLLQMRIFAEARKYLGDFSTSQIKIIGKDLAHLFQRYGLCESKHLKKWLDKGGWQQELWKEIYEGDSWSYLSKICDSVKSAEQAPFLFGFSALPASIALFFKRIQAQMFFFSPCRLFWADLHRHEEKSPLGFWGKWGMRFLNACSVEEMTTEEDYQEPSATGTLGVLQKSILDLEDLEVDEGIDSTIQIFSAKNHRQEVEELFESIARLLSNQEELKPSDILVLVPDLPSYVPHIHAVFQRGEAMFDYAISGIDRKSGSSLAQGFLLLFSVVEENWDLSALISLFSNASFSAKRKWEKGDLELIEKWLSIAKMTCGLSKMDFSIDRLILGFCSINPKLAPKPCPVIGWPESDLFSMLLQTIEELRLDLKFESEKPLGEWLSILLSWNDRYFDGEESWFKEEVGRLKESCIGCDDAIYSWQDAKSICEELFGKRTGSYQKHLLEAVHFDAFEEGNVLSKKVIALLGMHDSAFPRGDSETSLDHMEPKLPSRVEIDRFLFLEALMKAKGKIIISFLHSCPQKGIELSPSLILEELCSFSRGLTIEKLPELSFFTKDSYFSNARYRQAMAFNRRKECKNLFAREWQEMLPLPSLSIQDCEVEIADLQMLLRDPIEFFFKRNLGLSLDYKDESAFYEDDFFLKKYERHHLIENGLKSSWEESLKERERERGLPLGVFKEVTELKLRDEIEEVKEDCLRNNIALDKVQEIEIVPWKIQWDEKTCITLKGTIENISATQGLIEFFKEAPSRLSLWKRWPEILVLRGSPDLQRIPCQVVLTYAKKNAIRDFSHLDAEEEIRKLFHYYFMCSVRLSPLFPKWAEAIIDADPEKLLGKMQEGWQSKYANWLIQKDGLPNPAVLCNTWSELSKRTFAWFHEI